MVRTEQAELRRVLSERRARLKELRRLLAIHTEQADTPMGKAQREASLEELRGALGGFRAGDSGDKAIYCVALAQRALGHIDSGYRLQLQVEMLEKEMGDLTARLAPEE